MWLVVGLGNPGAKYARTRHNVGFMVLDSIADSHHLIFKEKEGYRTAKGSISGQQVELIEPLTFMNLSGSAVGEVCRKRSIVPENIIVVHDDLDIDAGRLKIRKKGSSGGHKGIESIIQRICSRDFIRVKIGIGRDPLIPTEKFVLSAFAPSERPLIRDAILKASEAVAFIIAEGPDRAMNRFNS